MKSRSIVDSISLVQGLRQCAGSSDPGIAHNDEYKHARRRLTAQQPRNSRQVGGRADVVRRRWGIILAGGDGVRLRGLTRLISGDDRPKQFCPLLGEGTLLEQARRRAEKSIPPEQILFALSRAHQDYYRDLGIRASQRIVQPCNRGTAPAILYTLLRIARMDPDGIAAILPCDHYYAPENNFTVALESAFEIAQARPQSVVLVGAQPKGPELEYGWIELGEPTRGCHAEVFHVRGFHEKPSLPLAEHLLRTGALWNTFVMVGHAQAFLELAREFVPGLLAAFRSEQALPPHGAEIRIADWLYARIAPADFSRQILSPGASRLVTLPLGGADWNDLGDPDRVFSTLLGSDAELPGWAVRWQAVRRAERTSACLAAIA